MTGKIIVDFFFTLGQYIFPPYFRSMIVELNMDSL